jgi:RNA polymerase sigma factor (sigma-70 family)
MLIVIVEVPNENVLILKHLPMNNIAFNNQICDQKRSLELFAFKFTQNNDDADDLVQDTMLRAMRYANLYKDGTNLRGWLYTIMKNTFINSYRVTSRRSQIVETTEDLSSFHLMKSADGNLGENSFVSEDIHKALSQLSPDYYLPFMKYFEGFKYHEIADELKIPIGTVKTRIHAARQLLKSNLKMYSQDYKKLNTYN